MSKEMNEISHAGVKLARFVTDAYAENANVRAVIVAGSVARGCADEYSDVEIGVFWENPPSDKERMEAISRIGGDLWTFDNYDGAKASEHVGLSGFTVGSTRYSGTLMVAPNHMTIDTAEEWIRALIDDLDTTSRNYVLAAAIDQGVPLHGHVLVDRWKEKVATFPLRLAVKLVQQNLWLGPWFNWVAYVRRADHLVLAQHKVWMQQRIVDLLAALNREYVPSPEYKWVERFIDGLQVKPRNCSQRLKATFLNDDVSEAMRNLVQLGQEVIDLVEEHLPEVNQMSPVDEHPDINTSWARRRWDPEDAYTLLTDIANHEADSSTASE